MTLLLELVFIIELYTIFMCLHRILSSSLKISLKLKSSTGKACDETSILDHNPYSFHASVLMSLPNFPLPKTLKLEEMYKSVKPLAGVARNKSVHPLNLCLVAKGLERYFPSSLPSTS